MSNSGKRLESTPRRPDDGQPGDGTHETSDRSDSSPIDDPASTAAPLLVVGVGASAGGLEACQQLLRGAPTEAGLAFVVVLHLAPEEESHLAEILQRVTALTVAQIAGGERVEPDHVYVIKPGTALGISDGVLVENAPEEPHYRARPIDALFTALAADQKAAAAGIVLSGTGEDGSAGLEEIREAGGLCLVQDPDTAEYDGMPRSAIDTGVAEAVTPPAAMGEILARFAADASRPESPGTEPPGTESPGTKSPGTESPPAGPGSEASEEPAIDLPDQGLEAILELLGTRFRVDFRNYKRGTMRRRAERRVELQRLRGWEAYREYLEEHPEEIEALYGDLLIGVTGFFRDPEEWELFAREIVPELVEERGNEAAVRAWSAGCATGEEAYGLAIVLIEHLESLEAAGRHVEVKVFASDASVGALETARRGRYPASIAEHVSADRLERFFRPSGEGFEVVRELREAVTFASHDLLSDPPFPHLDLVACRNVLIYLEPAAQKRLLERLHFALRAGGALWLGASEAIGGRRDLFTQIPGEHRIYRATGGGTPYSLTPRRAHGFPPSSAPTTSTPGAAAPRALRSIEKLVLQRHTSPCVVIDQELQILSFFGPTDPYLTRPQGEARLDLLSWVRPELYAKLRIGLAEAVDKNHPVTLTGLYLEGDTEARRVEIAIEPVPSGQREGGLLLVLFRSLPEPSSASPAEGEATGPAEPDAARAARTRQDLHDTREQLTTAVDQLRTITEEHAASYEELLSLNEELQSTNEELEASKEELQSLNEELTTTNRQLEERNDELRTLTSDLDNLLVSAEVPTVFLDRELKVRRFTPATTEVMRIGPADLGRPLDHISLRVRDGELLADAERVLRSPEPIEVEVGGGEPPRWFSRRVLPYRDADGKVDGVCLTYHEVTALKQAAEESEYARLYAEAIIRTSRTPLLVLDMDHRVKSANQAFYEVFEIGEDETIGRRIGELGNGQWAIPRVRALLEEAPARKQREIRDYDVEHDFEHIGWRSMRLNADVIPRTGRPDLILLSIEDITDLRKAQKTAQARADDLMQDHRRKDEFLAMLGHELRNPLAALTHGIDLLERSGDEAIRPVRELMARQTRRIKAMLDQLLDVGRVVSGKLELARESVDLTEAARAAVESVEPLVEAAGHELTVSLPAADTVLVLGDPVRLAQVAENLLANAVKYTEEGGRIWLDVEATDDEVVLSVKDTGIGIDPSVLDHVFELFTQAPAGLDRAQGGLGLGLALVHTLVGMHGGSVEAFSAGTGKGTEMVVTLPRLRSGRRAPDAGKTDVPPPAPAARRILVVDDEVDAAEALVQILELEGHTARAVPDGESALAEVQTFDPELVLLDLGLPGMDGYQVARKLRDRLGTRVAILALTGYRDEQDRLRDAGFNGHLLKPTSLDKLFAAIAELDGNGDRKS